jgi:hypothetical protein
MKYTDSKIYHHRKLSNLRSSKLINAPAQPDGILPGLWGGQLKGFGSIPSNSNCFISSSKPKKSAMWPIRPHITWLTRGKAAKEENSNQCRG